MIIIFDWDGTLCDSVDGIVTAMQAAAVEHCLAPPSESAVQNIVGLGLPQAMAELFPQQPEDERLILAEAYSRHYIEATAGPANLFPGAADTLAALRDSGFELAVATGKSRRGLDRVLAGIGMSDYFETTRCADETRSKPDPLMLEEILYERGKRASEAVMVGDSEYDLEMALRAGIPSIGVSFGVHSPERLARHRPLAVIDQLVELPSLVASLAVG